MIKFLATLKKIIVVLPAIIALIDKILDELSAFDVKKVK